KPVSGRGLRQLHEAGGATLALHRQGGRRRLRRAGGQGLPCVLLLHSQGGAFGFRVAEQRPDKVKAIVAVESTTAGDVGKAAALKNTPTLMLCGDYVDQHPRWVAYKKTDLAYAAAVRAGGGTVDVINLPDMGIKGNSHMLMQDKNNAEIADVIQK